MEIIQNLNQDKLTLAVTGSLDTVTSPDLLVALEANFDKISDLTLDFTQLEYISSAGLRVLLMANKKLMAKAGTMQIVGANESVREIFEMTGFADIFTIV